LENFSDTYKIVGAKLIPSSYDVFAFGEKAFLMDMKQAIFDDHNRGLLFYDIDMAQPLSAEDYKRIKKLKTQLDRFNGIRKRLNEFGVEDQAKVKDLKKRLDAKTEKSKTLLESLKEKGANGISLLDLGYVDSELFKSVLKTKIYGKILNTEMEKWAMIIIIVLLISLVAVMIFSMWKIVDLTDTIAKLQQGVTIGG
jgi:hypothetical protein